MALWENIVWLRYVKPDGSTVAHRFNALENPRVTYAKDGAIIQGNRSAHPFTYYRTARYIVLISADELYMQSAYEFMISFWYANEKHIAIDSSVTEPLDTEFISVYTDGGDAPEEFIEDVQELPDWTLELFETRRRVWNSGTNLWEPVYLA